nr:hypothetical protein [uncultured Kingella sp.]
MAIAKLVNHNAPHPRKGSLKTAHRMAQNMTQRRANNFQAALCQAQK